MQAALQQFAYSEFSAGPSSPQHFGRIQGQAK